MWDHSVNQVHLVNQVHVVNRYELETPRIAELTHVVVGEQRFALANRIAHPRVKPEGMRRRDMRWLEPTS
jgi:hypothetical protein